MKFAYDHLKKDIILLNIWYNANGTCLGSYFTLREFWKAAIDIVFCVFIIM